MNNYVLVVCTVIRLYSYTVMLVYFVNICAVRIRWW